MKYLSPAVNLIAIVAVSNDVSVSHSKIRTATSRYSGYSMHSAILF